MSSSAPSLVDFSRPISLLLRQPSLACLPRLPGQPTPLQLLALPPFWCHLSPRLQVLILHRHFLFGRHRNSRLLSSFLFFFFSSFYISLSLSLFFFFFYFYYLCFIPFFLFIFLFLFPFFFFIFSILFLLGLPCIPSPTVPPTHCDPIHLLPASSLSHQCRWRLPMSVFCWCMPPNSVNVCLSFGSFSFEAAFCSNSIVYFPVLE